MLTTSGHELFGGSMLSPVPDPYAVYRRLRAHHPVACVDGPLGPNYLITRRRDVFAVLKDPALYSSRANARGIGLVMGRTILEMEGKEHVRYRNLIAPFFARSALKNGLEETIAAIAHRLIDAFAADGRADLVAQFTFTFPLRVIAHVIGIPIDDYARFHRWALDLLAVGEDPTKALEAAQLIVDYLRPVLARRKAEPTGDLLSALAHAEVQNRWLSDDEVLSFLRLLLPAGAETTYRLLGSALFALLAHPEQFEAVRADRGRLDDLIEETLRWESPVQYVSRETTAPVTLAGEELPAGVLLSVALGSANRDEAHYPEPDRFDLDRRPDDHLAFGFGPHFCAGSYLARAEARIALDALLDRLPNLRLDVGSPCRVVGLAFRSPDRLPVRFDS